LTTVADIALQDAAARLAVLPFENLSADAAEALFARGFVEDLIVELARFPTLEVLHPDTSLAADEPPSALDGIGVSHHLRGTVRRTADAVRVTAQLVDASSGQRCWAERFDAPASDLLALQDEIVARLASATAIGIDVARLARARRKPLASLEVYDCWLRGVEALRRGTPDDDAAARALFERALEIDPTYARAHAGISLSHFNEWSCQAWECWDEKEARAFEHAQRAAALDDGDAIVQIVLGRVLLYRREFAPAQERIARALALNPNDADVLVHAAITRAYVGAAEEGVALARKAMRLHPRHPEFYVPCLAVPLFVAGAYDEACRVAARAPRSFVDLPAYLAASAALDGQHDLARRSLETFLTDFRDKIVFGAELDAGDPLRWIDLVNPFEQRADFERLAHGLEIAGLPADAPPTAVDAVTRRAPAAWRGAPGAPPTQTQRPTFRREGELWSVGFAGSVVRFGDAKGFGDLVVLLARPGEDVHCLELAGRDAEPRGADALFDERARREIRVRIDELEEQIAAADAAADPVRGERARDELDQLVTSLAGALGLGGRPRRAGSAVERARSTVTWRIRSAIRKIAGAHAPLGRHLENAIRTGTRCAYQPETAVDWLL
jgi:TolB-like protein/tetratricopeptide (TPR) repeat protein